MDRYLRLLLPLIGMTLLLIGPKSVAETPGIASLPMYEVSPAVRRADDVFWERLRGRLQREGIDAPIALDRGEANLIDLWKSKHLLLSQTCGYPYTYVLHAEGVKIVGTPVYAANAELRAGEYRSALVVRADARYTSIAELKGARAGINDFGSNSGMNAFRAAVASAFPREALKRGIFASVVASGGHLKSVQMIADKRIDVAAIDSVSYELIRREYPELAKKTRVLAYTAPSPGLPMITSASTSDETMRKLRRVIRDIIVNPGSDAALREALATMTLTDFVVIDEKEYLDRIAAFETMAQDKGYPQLK